MHVCLSTYMHTYLTNGYINVVWCNWCHTQSERKKSQKSQKVQKKVQKRQKKRKFLKWGSLLPDILLK